MKKLKEKETQTARKLRGGYYTPYPIAEYLWKYVKEKPQNAAEHKWLFDYDSSKDLDRFVEDLTLEGFKENEIEVHKTVHNYAVIVSHGFDSRKILAKYKDCELKRDAMLCVEWGIKE